MSSPSNSPYPSVDRISQYPEMGPMMETYGRTAVIGAIRAVLAEYRAARATGDDQPLSEPQICDAVRSFDHVVDWRAFSIFRRTLF